MRHGPNLIDVGQDPFCHRRGGGCLAPGRGNAEQKPSNRCSAQRFSEPRSRRHQRRYQWLHRMRFEPSPARICVLGKSLHCSLSAVIE
jgi:hypothetical protein